MSRLSILLLFVLLPFALESAGARADGISDSATSTITVIIPAKPSIYSVQQMSNSPTLKLTTNFDGEVTVRSVNGQVRTYPVKSFASVMPSKMLLQADDLVMVYPSI